MWKAALCALMSALALPTAQAMTYQAMSDDALRAAAGLIVNGTITAAGPAADRPLDATEYLLDVQHVLKGADPDATLRLRVPGAWDRAQDGALVVPGVPRFEVGESVLLLLHRRADGSYVPTQLGLGVFRYRWADDGEAVLERDLEDAEVLGEDDGVPRRRYRNAERFGHWLGEREHAGDDYWSAAADAHAPRPKYTLTQPRGRWFRFGQDQAAPIYASTVGQEGVSGGGYSELQDAIAVWNDDSGSRIRLAYAGTAAPGSGLGGADGVSQVLFNDPNDEIEGSFNCLTGGVAAYALWRGDLSGNYLGQTYRAITEGDVVLQDGSACMLNTRNRSNLRELLAHELGHVLGLDHSCGDDGLVACVVGGLLDQALMRPTLHGDGRGARLGSDDRSAVATLYDPGAVTTDPTVPVPMASSAGGASGGGGAPGAALLALFFAAAGLRRRLH